MHSDVYSVWFIYTKPWTKKPSCTDLHTAAQSFGVFGPSHPLANPLLLTWKKKIIKHNLLVQLLATCSTKIYNIPTHRSHNIVHVVHHK